MNGIAQEVVAQSEVVEETAEECRTAIFDILSEVEGLSGKKASAIAAMVARQIIAKLNQSL